MRETKKQLHSLGSTAVTTTNLHPATGNWTIAQGDTSVTRDGNEVYATSYFHKFILHANTTGSNSSLCRMVLYQPRHDKDDQITDLTVLNSVDTDKFNVMYDRTFELGFASGHSTGTKVINVSRKFKNPKKLYYAGSTAQAPISPVMKWVFVSDQASGDKPPTIQAQLTNYFKD